MVAVLFIAGDHDPVMPFTEVDGKADRKSPTQIGDTWLNCGITLGVTDTVIKAVVAHWPVLGLKVYVVVELVFIAGDQVPVMPSLDWIGRLNEPPEQISPSWVNVVVTIGRIVIVRLTGSAHSPILGLNK